MVHRPSSSEECAVFLDEGSNPSPLHWQADSIHWAARSDSNFKTSIKCYIKYLKELIVREEVWEEFINQIVREEQRRMEVKGV